MPLPSKVAPLQNVPFDRDGDPAFLRVDTVTPPHELAPGTAAGAVNKRFEQGEAWPRYGVACQPWGDLRTPLIAGGSTYANLGAPYGIFVMGGLTIGRRYYFAAKNGERLATSGGVAVLNGSGIFTAAAASYFINGPVGSIGQAVHAQVYLIPGNPKAFRRFNDPDGYDSLIVVTDDWRDGGGEDGGRGRAWRVRSGQGPQAVSLNGHDIVPDQTCRLVACSNGMALLRDGNERHYFPAANVDLAGSQLKLNCTPAWASGELVIFNIEPGGFIVGTSPPNALTLYYVKNIGLSGGKYVVELYTDAALTSKLTLGGGGQVQGTFYLERRAARPGYFGNGAPVLLMQPDGAGKTAQEAGFVSAPLQTAVTAYDAAAKVFTVPNHRLIPGDAISYVHAGGGGADELFYACPKSNHELTFHTSVLAALAGTSAQALAGAVFTATDYVKKTAAPAQAMPPGREGVYTKNNRLVVVSSRNNLSISDPLDPLHHQPMASDITANLGESDGITAVIEFAEDAVLIAKSGALHALANFAGGPTKWTLTNITREYGIEAPLSVVNVGRDAWGFGRKGMVSVRLTEQGKVQGVAVPVSRAMQAYLNQVDWRYAGQACAEVWNNRLFLGLPLKSGAGRNTGMLVHNFLNQTGDGSNPADYAWEGLWQGSALQAFALARHRVYGEERLCFLNYDGQVCWLSDAWTDTVGGTAAGIADQLTTRTYCRGDQTPKLFLKGQVVWETQGPKATISAQAPGHGESQTLLASKQYDATKYLAYGRADYNPVTDAPARFNEPDREDYSVTPGELLSAQTDVHQNIPENLRMRIADWGVQLVIANTQGSARVQAAQVEFVPGPNVASRST